MADATNHDEIIDQFVDLTSASKGDAQQYLQANRWNLQSAVTEFYTAHDEGLEAAQAGGEDDPQEAEAYTGPRTLDGRPAPAAIPTVGSSSRPAAPPKRGGIATLGSLNQGSSSGHGHAHDDDDDSDDDSFKPGEEPRDLFAGGEKSGLAVQDPHNRNRNDPKKVVKDILNKARANAKPSGGESSSAASSSRFRGSGQTLGGDDTPSQVIPDPNPRARDPGPTQTRILHLWEDGFSIEDGELRRFDDPQNANDLQMIRNGRAPLHLMNVNTDQQVDVQLMKHDENYKPQPKVYKPFSGGGKRLGSPTPGPSGSSNATTSAPAPAPAATAPTAIPEPTIDSSAPTVSLRIQLADGTRLPARFNTTQTIGDVYEFITRASSNPGGRDWVLVTNFPNKEHTDKSLALGDMQEFKRGGNAFQKWT